MACFCTGRCRMPPYTCSGTSAGRPWDIPWVDTDPYANPKILPPMPPFDIEKENFRHRNDTLETENKKLRDENEKLRRKLIELNISF